MAPTYAFTYFQVKALGESIRLLFTYGNIEFEDIRIATEDWPEFKKTTPLGVLPLLEVDGQKFHQSGAIARYVAKQVGLAGNNALEALEIDMVVDTLNDFRQKLAPILYEPDLVLKEKLFAQHQTETIPFFLKKLEELAAANKGHLAVNKLSWADFWFVGTLDYMNALTRQDIAANNPNLKAVRDNVLSLPAIKSWYEKSPKTFYY